jgi:hypothetical protein
MVVRSRGKKNILERLQHVLGVEYEKHILTRVGVKTLGIMETSECGQQILMLMFVEAASQMA